MAEDRFGSHCHQQWQDGKPRNGRDRRYEHLKTEQINSNTSKKAWRGK